MDGSYSSYGASCQFLHSGEHELYLRPVRTHPCPVTVMSLITHFLSIISHFTFSRAVLKVHHNITGGF